MENKKEEIRESIRKNYAEVALNGTEGGCGCSSGCCSGGTTENIRDTSRRAGYTEEDISNVPQESNMGLGCGNPIAIASLTEGETVLDLGSGGGFDYFLARRKVGETGSVIGVDMTPEMIKLARKNAEKTGYTNVEFRLGEIEHLPVADSTIDVIISNCVINLSLDKGQVWNEAYRVLKSGGRVKTSDIVAITQLPETIRNDIKLLASCIGGAAYIEDLKAILYNTGFQKIKLTPKEKSSEILNTRFPGKNLDNYVASYDIEAIK